MHKYLYDFPSFISNVKQNYSIMKLNVRKWHK